MAKFKEIEKNKVEIEFTVDDAAYAAAEQQAYNKLKNKFTVPGFRKGRAPKGMIEKTYGKGIFMEEAFDIAFPVAYEKALEELDIFPVSRPENVDVLSFESPITFKVEVYVKPEVELGKYTGITVEYNKTEVTEADVDAKLESVRDQNARFVAVDREAQMGDKVIIDYSGSVDGVKFDGGTAEEQSLDLGSGMFIPGFEEQVVGMKAADKKDIEVTFPEQYHSADLAGKAAVFAVVLHEVKEKQLPELDDEFAQDVSEFDTLAEYKASIKKELEEANERQMKTEKENALIERIVKDAKIDLPECMIDNQVDYSLQDMARSMMYQGLDLETYMSYVGTTIDELKAQMRPNAEKQVRAQLVLAEIAKELKLEVTDEDVKAFYAPMAEKQNKTVEEMMEGIKPDEIEYIKEKLKSDKLIDTLVENAKFRKKAVKAKKEDEE